ncbi:MlaD family protein [Pseudonocardia spinosispora]|uniref:MlaD family protein n=1 Tax=Pseudonocardia spinosispora TaxID=103441 RepID=UPI00040F89E4|nr:MlaD family protein [Pseudonocardia spinosispora]
MIAKRGIAVALASAALIAGYLLYAARSTEHLTVVLPNAIGVVVGTPVQVNGFDVGQVARITARENKAMVELELGGLAEPLHAGTTVTVEWRSVLGERYLQLRPGPPGNVVLPSGAMIQSGPRQVVVEDIVEALDAPTRAHLSSFLRQLDANLAGHEPDLNRTLAAAGPSVQALGAVLNATGTDGAAIRTVLTSLRQVTEVLAQRKAGLSSTVTDLDQLTSTAAVHQRELGAGLAQLPATLDATRNMLDKVPSTADVTVPLLDDLAPSAARLPGVAGNLRPVMNDLQPTVQRLGPTLVAADRLLDRAPDLLDTARDTLPQLRAVVEGAAPAVAFLRPYTPEAMGFISNWGNIYSAYDSQGHFVRPLVVGGPTAFSSSPNASTPGLTVSSSIAPGGLVEQPWTDAYGTGPR